MIEEMGYASASRMRPGASLYAHARGGGVPRANKAQVDSIFARLDGGNEDRFAGAARAARDAEPAGSVRLRVADARRRPNRSRRSPTRSTRRPKRSRRSKAGSPRGPFRKPRDALDLHLRPERQPVCAESRARRQAVGREISNVDFVELGPFRHVGEHHGAFDDIAKSRPQWRSTAPIFSIVCRAARHAARASVSVPGKLPKAGEIERLTGPHRRAERQP